MHFIIKYYTEHNKYINQSVHSSDELYSKNLVKGNYITTVDNKTFFINDLELIFNEYYECETIYVIAKETERPFK